MTRSGSIASSTAAPLLPQIRGPHDLKQLAPHQLPELAQEIRQVICDRVSQTGGHLAPNLGVVELTIALHYVFDFSHDRLLFDVGHQCYPHKLLTGRQDLFERLRQRDGMAGFPDPRESDYDLFSVGHAGTAVSTAVGLARGDDLLAGGPGQSDRRAVAVVGDASIVNGVAMEGLNNAGTLQRQFLTILNDNGMSISAPQGAMAAYFDRIRVSSTYVEMKKRSREILKRIPGGSYLEEFYHRASEMLKDAISHGHMFEHFGLICVGPVDGHDLPTLIPMFEELRQIERPVLLHVKTIKGKGFAFSEGDATAFHSPKPFRVEGCRVEVQRGGRSWTSAFADAMSDLMAQDEKIFACTAAMGPGTGVDKLIEKFPQRTLDTGICESHAMDMCAGMARSGVKPFFAVYSTFAQRAFDQLFQEVALQGLPVRVCMDRAGFVGGDGAVHHGFCDIALFRALPGVVQLAPCDEPGLRAALAFMAGYDQGATLIRYPRASVAEQPLVDAESCPPFELGKAHCIRPSHLKKEASIAVLAYGTMVYDALPAIETLEAEGVAIDLYDARFAVPVDTDLIRTLIRDGVRILTLEDHALVGGFGSGVLEACSELGLETQGIRRLGMPKRWIHQDSRAGQLAEAGMDTAAIRQTLREMAGFAKASPAEVFAPRSTVTASPQA